MRDRTEEPFFPRSPYRVPDSMMLDALKSWIEEHPSGIRSRAVAMMIEQRETATNAL